MPNRRGPNARRADRRRSGLAARLNETVQAGSTLLYGADEGTDRIAGTGWTRSKKCLIEKI